MIGRVLVIFHQLLLSLLSKWAMIQLFVAHLSPLYFLLAAKVHACFILPFSSETRSLHFEASIAARTVPASKHWRPRLFIAVIFRLPASHHVHYRRIVCATSSRWLSVVLVAFWNLRRGHAASSKHTSVPQRHTFILFVLRMASSLFLGAQHMNRVHRQRRAENEWPSFAVEALSLSQSTSQSHHS